MTHTMAKKTVDKNDKNDYFSNNSVEVVRIVSFSLLVLGLASIFAWVTYDREFDFEFHQINNSTMCKIFMPKK